MISRLTLPVLSLTLAAGCTRETLPSAPTVFALSPAVISPRQATQITIQGSNFSVRMQLELDEPGRSRAVGEYSATLAGAERVALLDLEVVDARTLRATVPALTAVGPYALALTDPWNRTARLADALYVAEECVTAAECADDGLSCTVAACVGTMCTHAPAPGFCLIGGACVADGARETAGGCSVCRPQVSATAWSQAINGTACDDGNGCTLGESCQEGACGVPTAQVSCPASAPANPCIADSRCEPSTGACVVTPRESACDDGYACTTADACVAGECRGTPACGNTPPRGCFTVHSAAETSPATFVVDARCSHDLESPDGDLVVRFGVDGAWKTAVAPLGAPLALSVEVPGAHVLQLEVTDPGGKRDYAERHVLVATPAETLVVTTPAAERDPDATPAAPGGTGFSFEEAVAYTNPDGGWPGLPAVIRFRAPMPVRPSTAVTLQAPNLRIGGRPGVTVDFGTMAANPCLTLAGTDQQLVGLELAGCEGVLMELAASSARLLDVHARGATGNGIDVAADQCRLGPGLIVEEMGGHGIHLGKSERTVILGAIVRGNALNGVDFDSNSSATVTRSELLFNGAAGMSLVKQNTTGSLWNNTVHGNFGDGVSARQQGAVTSTVDVRNNLLTSNAFGVCGQSTRFSALSPNGSSGNALGAYCALLDGGVTELEPRYLSPDAGDFRLLEGSGAIDAGVDLGAELPDLNGPAPGRWSGPAPDLGAHEVLE